ncbi:MAG: UvrD-helicase domain-containing protein, partial [Erysipelotrichaceae bacterium]|nr:UvrD-helicase domain-containing protein [Erysipelotrichaceae bacterium]
MSDDQARNKIINNVNTNYFVEAGAGSGKTTMLVERMVAMVEQDIKVDKICTITFTKAAANEFYARFQKRLAERASDTPEKEHYPGRLDAKTEETKKNCQEALVNIDTCFMGTIDAFCNMVLSEHPLEAGIPASSAVVDDETIINRYLQELKKIPVDDRYKELREKYSLFIDTQMNHIAAFKTVLSKVLEVRDAEFMYEKPVTRISFEKKYASDKKTLVKLFELLLKYQDSIAHMDSKESKECWNQLGQKRKTLMQDDWDDSFPFVLDALKKIAKLVVKPMDIEKYFDSSSMGRLTPTTTKSGKITNYKLSKEGFQDILEYMKDYQARVALDFTVECVRVMSKVLRKQGNLTFFDYKLYLRDLLKADAAGDHKLIEHIYDRHKYFLIDEFQDTDPMQAELFFYLAAEKFDEDWKKCIPHAGSLFIV